MQKILSREKTARYMPTLLELFSGTGSVGRAFRDKGWDVISVDIKRSFRPTLHMDVSEFDVERDLAGRKIDAIWASPPCTFYSKARTSCVTTPEELEASDALVRKVLAVGEALGGNLPMFIENPHSGKLKSRGILDHLSMRVVDYCKYGKPFRKRTSIWTTNTDWTPSRPLCRYDCAATTADGKRHAQYAQRGPHRDGQQRFTLQQLYSIPSELCDEIAEFMTSANEVATT